MEALAKGAQPTTMHRILDEHIQKLTDIGFYWNPKAARQNVKSKAASRTPKEATDAADAETDAAAIASAKDTTTLAGESAAGGSVTASAVKKVTAAAAAVPATAVPAASSSPEAPDGVVVAKVCAISSSPFHVSVHTHNHRWKIVANSSICLLLRNS